MPNELDTYGHQPAVRETIYRRPTEWTQVTVGREVKTRHGLGRVASEPRKFGSRMGVSVLHHHDKKPKTVFGLLALELVIRPTDDEWTTVGPSANAPRG